MGGLSFRLLGDLEVRDGSTPIPVRGGKLRVLLATLLLRANETVPVDELADRLWGGGSSRRARMTVQAYIMRLRQALGEPSLIRTRAGGYAIATTPEQVDLSRFRALVGQARRPDPAGAAAALHEALSLWRGPALADVPSESLQRDELPRLTEEYLRALESRVDLDLELGRCAELVAELSALTTKHPHRERFWGQLMLARYRSGQQAEALRCYREVRGLLVEELGVEPGPELAELHEAILRNDPRLSCRAPQRRSVPRQLPADVAAFAGRQGDLARLDGIAEAAGIVMIHGCAGVGKTALAVHWGHRAADRYPDGQLYIDLRGFDPDRPPVDPLDALGRFLRALGVDPGRIPANPDERAGLFRSTMASRRMLVVLDNAATADQVRPLLPGTSSCLAVVTSRNRIPGLAAIDGAQVVGLEVLGPAEALVLLENALGRQRVAGEPDAAARLAELCGYLPLALRVAAGKLIMRPGQPIAGAVAEFTRDGGLRALEVDDDRRATVRASFDLSYLALEPLARRMFRRLGLIAGPDFTGPAAAAVSGLPEDAATRLLDRLVAAHLVESPGGGRFRLHDLLRLHAQARCGLDETEGAQRDSVARLVDWYLATATTAAGMAYPHLLVTYDGHDAGTGLSLVDSKDAWAWLEDERANLVAAIDDAVRYGLSSVVWRLVDALRGFFLIRSYYDDWQHAARAGLRAIERTPDEQARAVMHLNLASTRWGLGDDRGHLEHSARALAHAQLAGWTLGEAKALSNLGNAHRGLGRHGQALEFLERALALRRALGAPAGIAHDLIVLGHTHAGLGNLRRSLDLLQEAQRIARDAGACHEAVIADLGLGQVYRALGRPGDAQRCFTASLAGARALGAGDRVAYNLGALAEIAHEAGRATEAHRLMDEALTLAREAARPETEVDVLNMAGRVATDAGRPRVAVEHHWRAMELARTIDDASNEVNSLLGLAGAQLGLGNSDDAFALAARALAICEPVRYRLLEGRALTMLAEIELARGNRPSATTFARRALPLQRATGYRAGARRTVRLLAELGVT